MLDAIQAGEVSLVFRCWRRPTVRAGGTLTTAIGVLAIEAVDTVDPAAITAAEARAAGYSSVASLQAALGDRDGEVYRIGVRYSGEDPRLALREDDDLDAAQLGDIEERLNRLDAASPVGPWTRRILVEIEQSPQTPAAALAEHLGLEKARLKGNVRKLKNLGLTVSRRVGYELSPRGVAVLDHHKRSG